MYLYYLFVTVGPVSNISVTTSSWWASINWIPISDSLVMTYNINITAESRQPIVVLQHPPVFITGLQAQTVYSIIVSVVTYDRQQPVQPAIRVFTTTGFCLCKSALHLVPQFLLV